MRALPNGKWIASTQEVAQLLGLSHRLIQKHIALGLMPVRRPGDRVFLLLPDDLDTYLERIADPGPGYAAA